MRASHARLISIGTADHHGECLVRRGRPGERSAGGLGGHVRHLANGSIGNVAGHAGDRRRVALHLPRVRYQALEQRRGAKVREIGVGCGEQLVGEAQSLGLGAQPEHQLTGETPHGRDRCRRGVPGRDEMVDRGEGVEGALDRTFAAQEIGGLVAIDRQTRSRQRRGAERGAVEVVVDRVEPPRRAAQWGNRSRQKMGKVRRLQRAAPGPDWHEREDVALRQVDERAS